MLHLFQFHRVGTGLFLFRLDFKLMEWTELGSGVIQGNELFWTLPPATGGDLWVRLPPSSDNQSVFLGVGDASNSPPDRLDGTLISLESFARIIKFELPDCLFAPFLGIRFLDNFLSNYSPSYRIMTFIPAPVTSLPVLSSVPYPEEYSDFTFILAGSGETISSLVNQATGARQWVGEDRVERFSFDAEISATVTGANADALLLSQPQVIWLASSGGPTYVKRASIAYLSGATEAATAVSAALGDPNQSIQLENTAPLIPAMILDGMPPDFSDNHLTSAEQLIFRLAAISDSPVKLAVEITYARVYYSGDEA
jgi:hypothetical protein